MRALFLSAQLPGHLDWGGYLATACALMDRGHDILWASGNEVLPLLEIEGVPAFALETTGWRWPPPPPIRPKPGTDRQQFTRLRMQRALDQWLEIERVTAATVEISALVDKFQPDLILSEMFMASAGLVAEQHGVLVLPYRLSRPASASSASAMEEPLAFGPCPVHRGREMIQSG